MTTTPRPGGLLGEILDPLFDLWEAARKGPVPELGDPPPAHLDLRSTTAEEACDRAVRWVGKPSTYRLGGGAHVSEPHPFSEDGTCDCSGFTAHVIGHNRIQRIAGKRISYYTDNIIRDAARFSGNQWRMTGRVVGDGPQHLYRRVTLSEKIQIGDLLVRQGKYLPPPVGRRYRIGHVCLVTGIGRPHQRLDPDWWRWLDCTHCTPNRGRESAVVRTNAASWRRDSFVIRPRWYR